MKGLIIYSTALCIFFASCETKKADEATLPTTESKNIKKVLTTDVLQQVNSNIIIGAAVNSNKFSNATYKDLAELFFVRSSPSTDQC